MLLLGAGFVVNGYTLIRTIVLKEAEDHVRAALRVAWSEYAHALNDLTRILQLIGGKSLVLQAIKNNDPGLLSPRLEVLMKQYGLDFMTIIDMNGRVFMRARYPHTIGDVAYLDGVVLGALKGKETRGTVTVPKEVLNLEGDGLAQKVFMELVPTPKAKLTPVDFIDAGLALKAAIPIRDGPNQIGAIYGGVLLNRNYAIVDSIQQTIFHEMDYDGRQLGTVTIFQGDTRIATTVRNQDGTRAIGTRVSSEVYNRVVENDLSWLGKAFVVRDWYLSAYDPLKSPDGDIAGIIYVGVLKKKFDDYEKSLLSRFVMIAVIGIVITLVLSSVLLYRFVKPINRVAMAAEQIAAGQFPSQIKEETTYKEAFDLAQAFNIMVASIRERDEQLRAMNADLTGMNEKLRKQNKDYMELLSFVAHELKSPIQSIMLGLSSMMSPALGALNQQQEKIAAIAMRNVSHVTTMIRNYLDLSRIEKGEFIVHVSTVLLEEEVIEPIKMEISSQLEAAQMTIYDEVPRGLRIECDGELTKVVMNNLLSNAAKYGRANSTIKILFKDLDDSIQVGVWNEGQGIAPANFDKLFVKFTDLVSRDRSGKRGTGLGLYITKEIIERHHGAIWVESEEGKWIQFSFRIPKVQEASSTGHGR